jgi:hypothetical protein
MSLIARFVDATATAFCSHEFASRHDPGRWYLECVKCGTLTPGIEVGPGRTHAHADHRVDEAVSTRRPLLSLLGLSRAA